MGYDRAFSEAFEQDLFDLQSQDARAYALWDEVVELIWGNDRIAELLTLNNSNHYEQPHFDTMHISVLCQAGFNVARVKLYQADGSRPLDHRLLYSIDYPSSAFEARLTMLALMPRAENYEPTQPYVARALADYDKLGIRRLHRV
jgi:hypothetical protein